MKAHVFALAAASFLIGSCAESDSRAPVRAPAMVAAGDPVSCIRAQQVRRSVVHDDFTIDFQMRNGDIFRNTLPARCSGLRFEPNLRFATSPTGQICAFDRIQLRRSTAQPGFPCQLGRFQPVRPLTEADSPSG